MVKVSSVASVVVEAGGAGVVGHAGLHSVGAFSDKIQLGALMSVAVPHAGERAPLHDRGTVLTHAMLMLAGGGEAVTDIEFLRAEPALFGPVASAPTLWRTLTGVTPAVLFDLWDVVGDVRSRVWEKAGLIDSDGPCRLDIDATHVEVHTETKQGAAANHKRGFSYHPMVCTADATGEVLSGVLRSGNATANDSADHLNVLDQAIDRLPSLIATGHRPGDTADMAGRVVQVRTDSAGCSKPFVNGCRARNVQFAVVARKNASIHSALLNLAVDDRRWHTPAGSVSAVAEITDLVDLDQWPERTRLIIRREPLHPGAQRSLIPSEDYRYWGHFTDIADELPADLDENMRLHAHVEDSIGRLKNMGANRMPFSNFTANSVWFALGCWADTLVRWFQLLCCDETLAKANPKRLRWELFHTPARLIRHGRRTIMRLLDEWPATEALTQIYHRITNMT